MITPPITTAGRDALLAETRRCGAARTETGAFVLISDSEVADVLALAGRLGIIRRREQFGVSGKAMARLFAWASERQMRVAMQIHSHGGAAFLSETDLRHGFSVHGFVTAVIPRFANPPADVADWRWWRYDREWIEQEAPSVVHGPVTTVVFDEGGVHDS